MTLIARTTNFRAPTVVADLLISARDTTLPFISPAAGKNLSPYLKNNEWQPVSLMQKLYILNKHVCLALAGNVLQMKRIFEDLSTFCAIPGITAEQIRGYISDFEFSNIPNATFFLLVLEDGDDGFVTASEFSHGQFGVGETELFSQTQASGSGSEDFMSFTNEKIEFTSSFTDDDPRQAIVKYGSIIARLLARERYTVGSLLRSWGGGYEIVFHDGREFRKLENIAYLLQHGIFDSDGEVAIEPPAQVLYYIYYGERLVIQTVTLDSLDVTYDENTITMSSNSTKVTVYPVDTLKMGIELSTQDSAPNSFETYQVALGFAIRTPTSPLFDYILIHLL